MRRLPLLLMLLWLLALAGPAGAESFAESLQVGQAGRLRLEIDRGSVEVVTHREANVHVRAEARGLGASSVRFELIRDGNDVVLRARTDEWLEWLSEGPRLDVLVWIPEHLEVVCASERALVTRRDAVELSYPTRAIGNRAP
jgi:hypothetical protein